MSTSVLKFFGLGAALIFLALAAGKDGQIGLAQRWTETPCPPTQPNTLCTLAGHTNWVHSVAFSPDGKLLASGSDDETIKLWDVATGRLLRTLTGHTHDIYSVAFSPDGKLLASGSDDETIKLWDVATGSEVRTLTGHNKGVYAVAFSPNGLLLASGSCAVDTGYCAEGEIKLWDIGTGQALHTLIAHTDWVWSVAFSPDGKLLASGSCGEIDESDYCHRGEIKLWDVATGQEIRSLSSQTETIFSVAFSPDGRTLVSGTSRESLPSPFPRVIPTITVWGVATGRQQYTLTDHEFAVFAVAFSPNGELFASGSADHTIMLSDLATGRELRQLSGYSFAVRSVAFSPDGKLLASGSCGKSNSSRTCIQGDIKLWYLGDLTGQ